MCGRFVSTAPPDMIGEYFGAEVAVETLGENYNVAPTQEVYGVVANGDGQRVLGAYRWGLLPSWATDVKVGNRMINARAETLSTKPAYAPIYRNRRCLIPMSGFYEWAPPRPEAAGSSKPTKQPYFIEPVTEPLFAVAGLWNAWNPRRGEGDDTGERLYTATVVTTAANDTMRPIHDRMPVLVPAAAWATWLDPGNDDLDTLNKFLVPAPNSWLAARPVTAAVNKVANNGAELLEPAEERADPDRAGG